MKRTVVIAAVLALVLTGLAAWCQGGPGGPPPGARGCSIPPTPPADATDRIATALSLTTDQAAALKTILATNDATIKPLMEAARTADKAVSDAFVAGDFDSAATLAATASEAQLAVVKANIAGWAAIKASEILTDTQFAQLLTGPGAPPPASQNNASTSSSSSSNTNRRR
jgi:Spy/CpxP family protein refolding chaperone